MYDTTSYGSWSPRASRFTQSPDEVINNYIGGGDREWRERCEESGALNEMHLAFRRAIEEALPDGLSLCGDEFIGPADRSELGDLSAYPLDEDGFLDIETIVEGIDVESIVDQYDPDNTTTEES